MGRAGLNTILLIEDDKLMRMMMRDTLDSEDFIILEASNGARSKDILHNHEINLIIVDLNLPDVCGVQLIRELRHKTSVPVVVVSGEEDEQKKVQSFENGADDFVTKPFHPELLSARVRAHIRRHYELEETILEHDRQQKQSLLSFLGWKLDVDKYQLFDTLGKSAEMSLSEFKILHYLILNCEKVVRREELATLVTDNPRHKISNRAIDVKITRIRKKIGDHPGHPEIIKTVYGAGYIFNKDFLKKNLPDN